MVRLLLARGADPNGTCTCGGGRARSGLPWCSGRRSSSTSSSVPAPIRTRSRLRERARSTSLACAATRTSPRACSTRVPRRRRPQRWLAPTCLHATGIKTIDLWCPLPTRGLVHLTPGFGLGAVVLVAELSRRAATSGRGVVWTGFVQAPTDLGDVHHGLAECALTDDVTVSMAPPAAPMTEQVAALDRGIQHAGDDDLLVVFAETGRLQSVDERLAALAARDGVTLIVAPLDGSATPPRRDSSPYLASIVFDAERAKRQRWPAVSSASWSKVGSPEMTALAERARTETTDRDRRIPRSALLRCRTRHRTAGRVRTRRGPARPVRSALLQPNATPTIH